MEDESLKVTISKNPQNSIGTVTLSSNNPSVATVDSDTGEVFALSVGDAEIIATVKWDSVVDQGAFQQSFPVKVTPILPKSLTLSDSEGSTLTKDSVISLKDGESFSPLAKISPNKAIGEVTYDSSNPGVAEVDAQTGEVTAVSAGTSTITATLSWPENGITKTLTQTFKVKVLAHINYTVTFVVENGSWDDGTREDKTAKLSGYEGDTLCLSGNQIPTAGEMPDEGFKTGDWDVTPVSGNEITSDTTYKYTYAKEEDPVEPDKPEPEQVVLERTLNGLLDENGNDIKLSVTKPVAPIYYDGKNHVVAGTVLKDSQKKSTSANIVVKVTGLTPMYKLSYVCKNNKLSSARKPYFYLKLALDKNSEQFKALDKSKKSAVSKALSAANKELKKESSRIGFEIQKRDLSTFKYLRTDSVKNGEAVVFADGEGNLMTVNVGISSKNGVNTAKIKNIKLTYLSGGENTKSKAITEGAKQIARTIENKEDGTFSISLEGCTSGKNLNYTGMLSYTGK